MTNVAEALRKISMNDVEPDHDDSIGDLFAKMRLVNAELETLNYQSSLIKHALLLKLIDEGQLDAIQIKPSILKRYK